MHALRQITRILLGLPIFLAIIASVVLLIVRMEGSMRTLASIALFLIGVVLLVLLICKNKKESRLVESLLDILYREVNPERFIEASEAALAKTKSRPLQNTLRLNLAVGYEAAGDFDGAIRTMKEIPIETADKVSKAMFYNNMAVFYAEKGAEHEALEAYSFGKPHFKKAEADIPSSYMALTRGLLYFVEGKYPEAVEAFENARSKGFEERHTMAKLQLFHARALSALGEKKEAKTILGKLCQKKTYPYLLEVARKELADLQE